MYFDCFRWPGFVHTLCFFKLLDGLVIGLSDGAAILITQQMRVTTVTVPRPYVSHSVFTPVSPLDTGPPKVKITNDIDKIPSENGRWARSAGLDTGPMVARTFTKHQRRLLARATSYAFGNPSLPRKGPRRKPKSPKPKSYFLH